MNLTTEQKATFKAWLEANAAGMTNDETATLANANVSPDYRVHRGNVTRVEVYKTTVPAGDSSTGVATQWEWNGYKAQSPSEQDAWKEMFMGGGADFGNLNNRQGVLKIFGTAGDGGANRVHIFNVVRRRASNYEKLFVVAVLTPPANTGNTSGQPRGSIANPDTLGIGADGLPILGPVSSNDIEIVKSS